ncbi:LPS-assembly protein LptD [Aquibium microcysteis]|uniref:LPS-assembly protein LptD n=1 Tax=Aquibium microcysteis TaxID=675281 RepID=UPI0030846E37
MALLCAFGAATVHAQELGDLAATSGDGPMLLEADNLVYDNDRKTVTAAGDVRIEYDGNRLVARRITYNQQTGRIVAVGDVEIIYRDGTRIFSDDIDVTDDFKDGFVNALRIQTVDDTYFAAESAERRAGLLTIFNNGVYTACAPCEDQPDKSPIWRVKSKKIIWNGQSRTVRFEQAQFEFFGMPLAHLPAFEIADPSVTRKTGFLIPSIGYSSDLGARLSQPYFIALAPNYDLTLTGHYYTRQGFLGEAEWRQRFDSGFYSLKAAGIMQQDPDAFDTGRLDAQETTRWMVGTKGRFTINPRWSFGWDALLQSDTNFSRTYGIEGFSQTRRVDKAYLTGLDDRNYFDVRVLKFRYQDRDVDNQRDPLQPWVLPSLDYSYTLDDPVAGGELGFDVNLQVVHRNKLDFAALNPLDDSTPRFGGVEGTSGRLTLATEWKRNFITQNGIVLTPLLSARGDVIGADLSTASAAAYSSMATGLAGLAYSHDGSSYGAVAADVRSSYYRGMATAGMEVRWPVMFSTTSASHVLEPIAQILVRPDAPYGNSLSIPNEDAQSLVFDATNLFEHDKFSGYDLMEGGTRANLGIRYSGDFGGGWTANAVFGQSYHIAGENPFAQPNLVSAGAYSGLETDVSDFVGMVSLQSPGSLTFSAGGRFDEKTLAVRRTDFAAQATVGRVDVVAGYTFIEKQPLYGLKFDRREISLGSRVQLNENWSVSGRGSYDFESETLVKSGINFAYADECFTYAMALTRTETIDDGKVDFDIGFRIGFRTIGDFGTASTDLPGLDGK